MGAIGYSGDMATRDGEGSSCGPNGGLLAKADAVAGFHEPIVLPSSGTNAPGQEPDIGVISSTMVAEFTLNTDKAYRTFKIPANYVDTPAFHVHWTKESGGGGDVDESTKEVRWRISYTVFPGNGNDINVAPTVIDLDDVYDDSGTTTRIVYRTANVAAVGFMANYYLGICVEAVTPGGVAIASEPALVSVDLTFNQLINQ